LALGFFYNPPASTAAVRLHVVSDLHLEFATYEPPPVDADAVVLAGDTHVGVRGVEWAAEAFPGRPVIYLLGNHEFYGRTAPDLIAKLRTRAAGSSVHVLSDEALLLGGVRFLGATLWTDFRLLCSSPRAPIVAQQSMVDYRKIRVSPRYRKLVPADTALWHARSVRWLREVLAAPFEGPTVIVTHHAPSLRSVAPSRAGDELSAAYASALDGLVESSGARYWIHGHTHHNVCYEIGATTVLSNQRGYPDEPVAEFDPALVLNL
jgi:UDP-2,3-diacylglucosamine pyrophosphatase LpxH